MRSRPVALLVLVQVALALALVVVAFLGQQSRADLQGQLGAARAETTRLSAELTSTKKQAAKDRAQMVAQLAAARARVDALEAALRRQGVDPGTVVIVQSSPATASASRSVPRSAASPAASPASRPSTAPPSPSPSPICRTAYNPLTGRCLT